MFETCENTPVNAAILCLAVHVCDVMNKVSMYGRSVYYILSQLFPLFFHKSKPQKAVPQGTQNSSKKVLLLYIYSDGTTIIL